MKMPEMDWQVFCQDTYTQEVIQGCFGQGRDKTYLDWLFSAWGYTVGVSLTALLIALIVGSIIGIMRTLPAEGAGAAKSYKYANQFGAIWVEIFRNIPLLVQIFLWYHVAPALFTPLQKVPAFILVVISLGFFTSARIAEQVRTGIEALPRGQKNAGLALGMTTAQYYRYIILPMAYRIIIPPLTSETMNIFKNSSVAFAVSIPELTNFAMQVGEETSRPIEVYMAVTVLYIISALIINRIMAFIEKKSRVAGFSVNLAAGGH